MNWEFKMKRFFVLIFVVVLTGCSLKPSLKDDKLSDLQLNLEEFFDGQVIAYGQFQDILGNVSRRFVVNVSGTWDGKLLTLVEDFTYSDGTEEQRIWTLTKTGENTWTGDAAGVIGPASGEESGDTFYWAYTIDLPVTDGTMRVSFNDYMWLQTPDRLFNKAYMSKWGFPLGEVSIMFEKQP